MSTKEFFGAMTALVTPFTDNGLDLEALKGFVEWQLESGIHGLVPCGSTGEAATMTEAERLAVIETVVKVVDGRVPVIAGAGSNNTAQTVEFSKKVAGLGVDGLLVVCPYYNKPTQGGIVAHMEAVATAVDTPIVVYDVPGRTGSHMLPDTTARLAAIPNIVGIKDASGDICNGVEILRQARDFTLLSGDDSLFLPFLAVGAKGLISVTSNIVPKQMADIYNAWADDDFDKAQSIYYEMYPVFCSMFYESNPIPAKTALQLMGKLNSKLRLPLTPMTGPAKDRLTLVLSEAGLI